MTDNPKTISKEAAKLLGIPFAWQHTHVLRYVRMPDGFELERFVARGWERIDTPAELIDGYYTALGDPEIQEEFDDRLKENQP